MKRRLLLCVALPFFLVFLLMGTAAIIIHTSPVEEAIYWEAIR